MAMIELFRKPYPPHDNTLGHLNRAQIDCFSSIGLKKFQSQAYRGVDAQMELY
ncbi:hypothetical protein J2T55_002556 [Methylohalomonas lacus]|uniref:Uncharacterized protein n=1 Tax=Methylohalomonas lacus TaxID=398773 RepID=A0AAE3HP94_9GAMM|nr:hypothetical protein [Methylohalomonas lacus]